MTPGPYQSRGWDNSLDRFLELQNEVDGLLQETTTAQWSDYSRLKQGLIDFQQRIKENNNVLTHQHRQALWGMTQEGFAYLQTIREEKQQQSETHSRECHGLLDDLEEMASSVNWREYSNLVEDLEVVRDMISSPALFPDVRNDLRARLKPLQEQFNAHAGRELSPDLHASFVEDLHSLERRLRSGSELIDPLLSELDDLCSSPLLTMKTSTKRRNVIQRAEDLSAFGYYKNKERRLTSFDKLVLPSIPQLERERTPFIPELITDAQPLLNLYENVLSFRGGNQAEFREQQVQFMTLCYEGVIHGRDVVAEGPTGLGKTRAIFGALFPYLKAHPKARVIYSTRTITQVYNVLRELRDLLTRPESPFGPLDADLFVGLGRVREDVCALLDPGARTHERYCYRLEEGEENRPVCPLTDTKRDFKPDQSIPLSTILERDVLGHEELFEVRRQEFCPAPYFKKKAEHARILLCPHTYLFDEEWKRRFFGDLSKEDVMLVIDEAHNFVDDLSTQPMLTLNYQPAHELNREDYLEDRMRNAYNLEHLVTRGVRASLAQLKTTASNDPLLPDVFVYLDLAAQAFRSAVHTQLSPETLLPSLPDSLETHILAEERVLAVIEKMGEPFLENLRRLQGKVNELIERGYQEKQNFSSVALKRLHSSHQILSSLLGVMEDPYSHIITTEADHTISVYALHPSIMAQRVTDGFRSTLYTSATLSPPEEIAYLLGLEQPLCARLDPVFKDEQYLPFFVGGVNSSPKKQADGTSLTFTSREKGILRKLFSTALPPAQGKNVGVFCASNVVVQEVHQILKPLQQSLDFLLLTYLPENGDHNGARRRPQDDYRTLCSLVRAEPHVAAAPTGKHYIDVFKQAAELKKTVVLLSVAGGSLSEGVDYLGKQMEMVMTVGLPYPSSAADLRINTVKEDYFTMRRGDRELGRDLAYRHNAFRKLNQSVGRAIRSLKDRAVVICADERLLGIKNVADRGADRYEFLSIPNARNNLQLLPRPLQRFGNNIILVADDRFEDRVLKEYVTSEKSFASPNDFITFEHMKQRIGEFYRHG